MAPYCGSSSTRIAEGIKPALYLIQDYTVVSVHMLHRGCKIAEKALG